MTRRLFYADAERPLLTGWLETSDTPGLEGITTIRLYDDTDMIAEVAGAIEGEPAATVEEAMAKVRAAHEQGKSFDDVDDEAIVDFARRFFQQYKEKDQCAGCDVCHDDDDVIEVEHGSCYGLTIAGFQMVGRVVVKSLADEMELKSLLNRGAIKLKVHHPMIPAKGQTAIYSLDTITRPISAKEYKVALRTMAESRADLKRLRKETNDFMKDDGD